jgi:hypothetical protein
MPHRPKQTGIMVAESCKKVFHLFIRHISATKLRRKVKIRTLLHEEFSLAAARTDFLPRRWDFFRRADKRLRACRQAASGMQTNFLGKGTKFPSTRHIFLCAAPQNYFKGLEINFKATEIYFKASEIYFRTTKKVLSRGAKHLFPQDEEIVPAEGSICSRKMRKLFPRREAFVPF